MLDGELVVDLWGGYRDAARSLAWTADTLVCVFSVGKPIAALPLLRLIDQGKVALEDRVTAYWPESKVNAFPACNQFRQRPALQGIIAKGPKRRT